MWPCDGLAICLGPRLSPDDRWDRLQPPRDPTDGLSGYRKWMDGFLPDCNGKLILICIVLSVTVYDLQMTKLQGTTLPCFSEIPLYNGGLVIIR